MDMMRGMRRVFSLIPCCLVLLSGGMQGCATRQSVDSLHRQMQQLEQKNFQLRKELAEARVRAQIRAERDSAAPPQAEAPLAPSPAGSAEGESAAPAVIFSEPITDASRYTSGPLSAQPPRGATPAARPAGRPGSPTVLMTQAREALDRHHPDVALTLFQQIVSTSPDDALADDAQFGTGECYFQQQKYEEAILAYRKVIQSFPYGDQAPSALLKIGFSQLALGQRGTALESFRSVSESYPGTEAATVARQQIGHLKAGGN
jgi:tol-pal system protein YbgF